MSSEMISRKIEQVRFPAFGSQLMLEGEYSAPEKGRTWFGAVLCHPHPLYGGNMHNIIILKLRDALNADGITTLRFNFRGTGLSEGEHDNGQGEVYDLIGACRYLTDRGILSSRQIIAGYSFGAAMVLRYLENNPSAFCFLGIAVPTAFPEYFHQDALIRTAGILISGENDDISSVEDALKLLSFKNVETVMVPGGNHLFTGMLPGEKRSRISFVTETCMRFIRKLTVNPPDIESNTT